MHPWQTASAIAGGVLGTLGLLAGGAAYAAQWPTSQLFGQTLIDVPDPYPQRHTLALTYDDGPSPRNTPALLAVLAKHDVRATFFLIGNHVRRHPAIARDVLAAGHTIGNHTDMHPNLARKDDKRVRAEIERCQKTLEETLGISPWLFRPPYGARRPGVLRIARSLGLVPALWNVTVGDWKRLPEEELLRRVTTGIGRNRRRTRTSNVLLHDASHLDSVDIADRGATVRLTAALLNLSDLRFDTLKYWSQPPELAKHGGAV